MKTHRINKTQAAQSFCFQTQHVFGFLVGSLLNVRYIESCSGIVSKFKTDEKVESRYLKSGQFNDFSSLINGISDRIEVRDSLGHYFLSIDSNGRQYMTPINDSVYK